MCGGGRFARAKGRYEGRGNEWDTCFERHREYKKKLERKTVSRAVFQVSAGCSLLPPVMVTGQAVWKLQDSGTALSAAKTLLG